MQTIKFRFEDNTLLMLFLTGNISGSYL